MDRRQDRRRLRPPADRDHGALAPLPRARPARGLEREGLRRRPRASWRRGRRRSCGGRSTSTTGARFSHSFRALRDLLGDVAAGRRGAKPASVVVLAGDVHHAYLCEVGWPRRRGGRQGADLPGGLLAVPQPALEQRAAGDQGRLHAALHPGGGGAGEGGRRRGPGDPLAASRRPLLRQPGRDPSPRRPRGDDAPRQDQPRRRRPAVAGVQLRAPPRLAPGLGDLGRLLAVDGACCCRRRRCSRRRRLCRPACRSRRGRAACWGRCRR